MVGQPRLRQNARGFTLVEVMVAAMVFAIAFCGIIALLMLFIRMDVDSENELLVAARARHQLEYIRSTAASQVANPISPGDRPGIAAVYHLFSNTTANNDWKTAGRARFAMDPPLPMIPDDEQPIGEVHLYTNESRVPAYFSRFGDFGDTIIDLTGNTSDELIYFDLDGDNIDSGNVNPGDLRLLPVEIIVRYTDIHNVERVCRLATIIVN